VRPHRSERAAARGLSAQRPDGRKLPEYLRKLRLALSTREGAILGQMDQLSRHLEHMKKIIAAQQSYAKVNGMTEGLHAEEIAETALQISEGVLRNSGIEVARSYEKLPPVLVDRHQLMQILVNLISNAKHALEEASPPKRELMVAIAQSRRRLCASRCATTASASLRRTSRRSSTTASRPRSTATALACITARTPRSRWTAA
jgi:signal transduction histidine kinase